MGSGVEHSFPKVRTMPTYIDSARTRFAASLATVLVAGMATQRTDGTDWNWVARQLGGVFYVLAGIFSVLLIFPSWRPNWVCLGALFITVSVEFAQLWHPTWLDALRSTGLG